MPKRWRPPPTKDPKPRNDLTIQELIAKEKADKAAQSSGNKRALEMYEQDLEDKPLTVKDPLKERKKAEKKAKKEEKKAKKKEKKEEKDEKKKDHRIRKEASR
eukprot:gnl/MRDRNA2_/MRDRNA2_88591_c0_seq1.p1 gnl/MRDRNA2_/MRDRNA2_88591_c0~~gnl/MRDRNA2_/MRDRNA2_88591_c0_seq1.p1  ORF type:complete len:103 (+),score=47.68 gnl/MRDRNA2_/MRDRNA2_88591_c0_seq1:63-371(+)